MNEAPHADSHILESLRRNAARKSGLDADKELLTKAADEIERLSAEVKRLSAAQPQSPTNTIEHFDDLISPQQEPA